jgi:hypothetical protein
LLLWDGESELGFLYLKFCLRCVGDLGSIDFSFRYYIDPGVRRFFHTIAEIVETYHQKQSTETIASAQRSHTSRDRTDNIIARAFPWAIAPTCSHASITLIRGFL